MSFFENVKRVYENNKQIESSERGSQHYHRYVAAEIGRIESALMKNARKGINEVRLASEVDYGIIKHFKKLGFIIWENSLVTVIRIPEQ